MEMNLQKRAGGLKEKIPEIKKTLETVRFLKLRKVSFLSSSSCFFLPSSSQGDCVERLDR